MLVIIGLLIGGILVGQSLIESAKMQSFVRQMAQYDAAVAMFKGKYKNLPGDNSWFGCTDNMSGSGNTCNNGVIQPFIASTTLYFLSETALFWKSLSDSGFKPEGKTFTETVPASTIVTIDTNVPKAKIGTAGVAAANLAGVNSYYVGNYDAGQEINQTAGLSAVDSLAFDSKVDDGAATTGNVQVGLSAASASCNSGSTYVVASGTTLVCSLAVKMLSDMNF